MFFSTELLEKYWPKLCGRTLPRRCERAKEVEVGVSQAQAFLGDMEGRREMIESDRGFTVTQKSLETDQSVLANVTAAKTGFDVHIARWLSEKE